MRSKNTFIIIMVVALIVLGSILYSVSSFYSDKKQVFISDGYVIVENQKNIEKVYFNSGNKYKSKYSGNIIFKNKENKEIEISKNSFLFYNDDTIGFLNKGVLLSLDDLQSEFIPFYNVKANYHLKKENNKYYILNANKKVYFNNIIAKIDENRYLFIGNDLSLKVTGNDTNYENYFFDIEFKDGNIVSINNDEINLETINNESIIYVGNNIKINLNNKVIYYNDEEVLTLNKINIDNDSNIEVDEETEEVIVPEPTIINKEKVEYITQTVIDYKNKPYIEVIEANTDFNSINLKFNVIDTNNLLQNGIKVCYQSTNKAICNLYSNFNELINYEIEGLTPNTSYLVTVTGNYSSNGTVYNTTLLSRIFTTSQLDIEIDKNYVTNNTINLNVNTNDYNNINSFKINIYDSTNTLVDERLIENIDSNNMNVSFTDLKSDELYSIELTDIYYKGFVISSSDINEIRTLKSTILDQNIVDITPQITVNDDKNGFLIDCINEIDNFDISSIKSITYELYDNNNEELVKTIETKNTDSVLFKLTDNIVKNKYYYAKAIINIYDGEKNIEYQTNKSNIATIDLKKLPSLYFVDQTLIDNTLKGHYLIIDDDQTLDYDSDIYITYTDITSQNTKTIYLDKSDAFKKGISEKKNYHVLDLNLDLDENTIYTIRFYANAKLDNNVTEDIYYEFDVRTSEIDKIYVTLETLNVEDDKLFDEMFNINLKYSVDENTNETIKNNLSQFDVSLYTTYKDEEILLGSYKVNDKDKASKYFNNEGVNLNVNNFGITLNDIFNKVGIVSKNYYLKITNGYSGEYSVAFEAIGANKLNFEIDDKLIALLSEDADITVEQIKNNGVINNLKDDTTTGLRIIAEFDNNKTIAKKIKYKISDLITKDVLEFEQNVNLLENDPYPVYDIYFSDNLNKDNFLVRGHSYIVEYTVVLDISGSTYEYPFLNNDRNTPNPVKSEQIDILKESPSMELFIWDSNENSITYKYKIKDQDLSLKDSNIYYNDNIADKVDCQKLNNYNSNYSCIKFNNLTSESNYTVSLKPELIDGKKTNLDIDTYTFEGIKNNLDSIKVTGLINNQESIYANILALKLEDSTNNINRVSYYTLELSYDNKKYEISNITNIFNEGTYYSNNTIKYTENTNSIIYPAINETNHEEMLKNIAYVAKCQDDDNNCIYFDYSKLYNSNTFGQVFKDSINKEITIKIKATYDSGKVGFYINPSKRYIFQVISGVNYTDTQLINRYIYSVGNNISVHDNALTQVYNYLYTTSGTYFYGYVDDGTDNKISLTNISFNSLNDKIFNSNNYYANKKDLTYNINGYGITININNKDVPIVAKELTQTDLKDLITFKYQDIIPGINMRINPKPTINGLKLDMNISGLNDNLMYKEDNKLYLYLEVYNDTTLKDTYQINYNYLNSQSGVIENNKFTLSKNNNYYYDITNVKIDGVSVNNYNYDYKTGIISNINGTNIEVSYKIVLNGLNPNTEYNLKMYMKNSSTKKLYLRDLNSSTYDIYDYSFKTLNFSDIEVENTSFTIESDRSSERYLNTKYEISDILGIDNLEYSICYNGKCVDTTTYQLCEDSYNNINGSCINRDYEINYKTNAKYKDIIDDFIYNTEYDLVIKAVVNGNIKESIYTDKVLVPELIDPKFKVARSSKYVSGDKSTLTFVIDSEDTDFIITNNGQYTVDLYKVTGATSTKIGNTKSLLVSDSPNTIEYNDLDLDTEYDLVVTYNVYKNNYDNIGNEETVNLTYPTYTVNSHNVSAGVIDIDTVSDSHNFLIKFFYSSNLTFNLDNDNNLDSNQEAYVGAINYKYRLKGGSEKSVSGTIVLNSYEEFKGYNVNTINLFNNEHLIYIEQPILTQCIDCQKENIEYYKDENENSYYQIKIPHNGLTPGLYTIDLNFFLTGKITSTYNSVDKCYDLNDSSSNLSNLYIEYKKQSESINRCLKYNSITYSNETYYGGAV